MVFTEYIDGYVFYVEIYSLEHTQWKAVYVLKKKRKIDDS